MKNLLLLTMIAIVLLLSGCATMSVDNYLKDGNIKPRISNVSDEKYLRTIGIGACDQTMTNDTQRKATSKNSAVANARYELLAVIKGLTLEGGIEVGKAIEKDDTIKERADRIVRGAEVIDYQWTKDDGCIVTIQLERAKIKEILNEDKYENPKQQLSYKPPEEPQDTKYGALITGILIPTGGLWYTGHCETGLYMLLGIGTCLGIADYMATSPTVNPDDRDLKWIGVGGAVALDLWAIIMGHNLDNNKPLLAVLPYKDGMQVACSFQFN